MRHLLDHQKRDVVPRADQRAGMDHAFRHDSVEGRGDFQIALQVLERPDRRLCRPACLQAGIQERLGGVHLFFRLDQLVAGDRAGCFSGLLRAIVRALRRRKLSFGLQPVGLGRLHFRLSFGNLRGHFRSAHFDEQITLFDDTAAVHQDAIHVARNLGMKRDAQERQKLARQFDGSRHRLGHDRSQIAGLRPTGLREQSENINRAKGKF